MHNPPPCLALPSLLHIKAYIHFKEREKNCIPPKNTPHTTEHRRVGASHPSEAALHTRSTPVKLSVDLEDTSMKSTRSRLHPCFLSKQMHYESLIRSIINDSKPIALNINLSQVSSDKLLASESPCFSKEQVFKRKGKCFGRWALQWRPPLFSFSYSHSILNDQNWNNMTWQVIDFCH